LTIAWDFLLIMFNISRILLFSEEHESIIEKVSKVKKPTMNVS